MDAYQAGQQLGTLLFGQGASAGNPDGSPSLYDAVTGNAGHGMPYYRTLTAGATAQNVMQEARANRAKALVEEQRAQSRARQVANYVAMGVPQAQAQFMADADNGATTSNPTQIVATLPQMGAYQAATLGDDATLNRMDAARTGAPLKLSDTSGGITTANPYTAPAVAPNALGDAAIAANQALVGERNAQAARAHAGIGADKSSNYAIETDGGGNMVRVNKLTGEVSPLTTAPNVPLKAAPKGGKVSAQDAQTIAGFRQRIAAGKATPEQVAAFLVKQGRPDLAKEIYNPTYVVGTGVDDGGE